MPALKRTQIKSFNPALLVEELSPLPIQSLTWAGFERVTTRQYAPFAEATRIVGYSSASGNDVADRGELRITTSRDLTTAESSQLDSKLTAHNFTLRTTEQTRQDQDEADLSTLETAYNDGSLLSLAKRDEMFMKAMRLLLRQFRRGGAAI